MTKQRRNEIFNVPLAKRILADYSNQLKDEDIHKLKKLLKNRKSWNLNPLYRQGGYDLDGRNYCERGLCIFSRKLRNTLSYQFYKDIDMVNAGYTCLALFFRKYPDLKETPEGKAIYKYYRKRDSMLTKYCEKNFCERDEAKKFFISKIFDGSNVCINEITKREMETDENIKEFYNKLPPNETNKLGRTFCLIYHKWEYNTLNTLQDFFENKGIYTYADLHDGFFVKKETDDEILESVIEDCYEKYHIHMKIKKMDDLLDIPREFIENYKQSVAQTEEETYKYLKEKFEDIYGVHKIIEHNGYLIQKNSDYYFKSQAEMLTSFNDWTEAGTDEFSIYADGKRFIYNYIQDPYKRIKETIGFYPQENLCPDNEYNIFKGFRITQFQFDTFEEDDYEDLDIIKEHIRFLTDDMSELANDCKEYLLDWIAHIFQKPHLKTNTMIILKGGEGIGKGIFMSMLSNMIGQNYYYQTPDPQRDLFGNFNSIGKAKLLINFDEGDKSQTDKFYEQLKNSITEEFETCREKYQKSITLKNYARYCMTTNNDNVIKISDTNRRFVGFECRHPRKDPSKILKAMKNDKALYLFYKFLMKRDIENINWENDFPKTSYYRRCLDDSIPFVWLFINYYFGGIGRTFHKSRGGECIRMNELFNEYEAYCSEYRTVPVKKQEFNSQLEATYLFTKQRANHGNIYIFHLSKVLEKLKKLGIYEEVLFLED
tara:strand:- start:1122 stop:3260 length:2139 start_codon:yes stop_codon:yes gene_type:complete